MPLCARLSSSFNVKLRAQFGKLFSSWAKRERRALYSLSLLFLRWKCWRRLQRLDGCFCEDTTPPNPQKKRERKWKEETVGSLRNYSRLRFREGLVWWAVTSVPPPPLGPPPPPPPPSPTALESRSGNAISAQSWTTTHHTLTRATVVTLFFLFFFFLLGFKNWGLF